ncbi:zinc finger protein [Holotrichia oblita]|uniref:Zinc finger protein n=1 Tax=Holotrichia oblita TaxID=644536 RepID=A0ACB9TXC2_HOLOL|nr:zinc finger protein [Holotrichia oblita]
MEVEDVCRICDKPSTKLFGIFEKNADGKQIFNLIKETLPIVIYRKDPLSKVICEKCLDNVRQIHAFRKSTLGTVDQQIKRLKTKETRDVLLYLDTFNNADESELWMYSSPIKKKWDKPYEICAKCKVEIPKEVKPFRKYREAFFNTDSAVNGYVNETVELESVNKISLKRLYKASHTYDCFIKRPRIMGPKSKTQPFIRSFYTEIPVYNPLTLVGCCLNVINKENVPDYKAVTSEESVEILETNEYVCEICSEEFGNQEALAGHEVKHMKIKLNRVDNIEFWGPTIEGATYRNKWLRDNYDESGEWEDYNEDEDMDDEAGNLLMPLEETITELKGEIELVDAKPMVNGVLLSEIPKTERRAYYNQNYNLNGVKRKFCPLCRYTFKDNWAIELHYFSSACYYTCRYCGIRFNKQRAQFDEHVQQHIDKGDVKSDKVYSARKKNDPIPKVLCDAKTARNYLCSSPKLHPKVKPLKMRHLLERNCGPPKTTLSAYNDSQNMDKQNQAYFCRKCYKVFFKLDEFNNHVSNCTETPEDHPDDNPTFMEEEEKYEPPRKYRKTIVSPTHSRSDESFSSTGRPIRNCVKDVHYKDHLDIDVEQEEEEEVPRDGMHFKGIECGLCNAVFPTIPSRNSHMRIHKNGFKFTSKGQIIYTQKPGQNSNSYQDNYSEELYSNYDDMPIKQEPLEPLVEIHESNSIHDIPSSIGSVSITPIPNKMQKTTINPDIMKLVQSNPNITIRSMHPSPSESSIIDNAMDDASRNRYVSYRCSSCAKTFSNKSNLYFHKKNQCEGSRYPCPFCKKRFGTEAAYSSHIFYSHPE